MIKGKHYHNPILIENASIWGIVKASLLFLWTVNQNGPLQKKKKHWISNAPTFERIHNLWIIRNIIIKDIKYINLHTLKHVM
jgi:hypothetical protein